MEPSLHSVVVTGEDARNRKIQIHLFLRLSTIIIAFLLALFFNARQAANFHKFHAGFLAPEKKAASVIKGELKIVQSFRLALWNEKL